MTARPLRSLLRGGVVLGVAAVAALATALPASAHVTAQPGQAEQGGFTKISFRVPDESDTAGTVKLEVILPADHPISSVQTTPVPGWTVQVVKAPLTPPVQDDGRTVTEAARTITWTANPGTRINPGEFVDFDVSLGPLPTGVDQLVLPAVQTYDNGEVVSWIERQAPGSAEPQHPAPVVKLTPAAAATGAAPAAPAADPASGTGGSDTIARWLAGAALLVGALGLGVGIGAVARSRRNPARPSPADQHERVSA